MAKKVNVVFSDMISESWCLRGKLEVIPRVGEYVQLPQEGQAKVYSVTHKYEGGDNDLELSHVEIIVEWHVKD